MAGKNNIRSMRISDTMIEMIESQAGETFTAKFEALVTRCMWELPAKERELQHIQELIKQERDRLDRMRKYSREIENNQTRLLNALSQVNAQLEITTANFKHMIDNA